MLYEQNFAILFRQNSWRHRFTFCFQFYWELAAGKHLKRCIVWWQKKFGKRAFFAAILCPFGGEHQTFAEESATTFPCKISSQSDAVFPELFRKVISQKVISYDRNNYMALAYVVYGLAMFKIFTLSYRVNRLSIVW